MDHASQMPPQAVLAAPDLTGRTLGDYRILRKLGQGGMGQVYLAEQVSLKRKVALKFLRADLAADSEALARFRREAEAVARATHANIVQVHAIGEEDGLHYMALEYIDGRTLKDYLARKGPPELPLALSIMRQTASALQRAAELGIVHRDIKPENILLTRKAEVKVADFGLSRCLAPDQQPLNLTQSGVTMGTPLYMSPEQVEGRPLDPRSDIYSFGVTCYHMLAGRPPFQGGNAFEVALQHVQTAPQPLAELRGDLPPELCAIIHQMMAKKPEERYQSCRELLRDLARIRAGLGGAPTGAADIVSVSREASDATKTKIIAPPGRRWLPWLVAASLVVSAAIGAALAWARLHKQGVASSSNTDAADATAVEALFSKQKHEQFLKDAIEEYAEPGNKPAKVRLGVSHIAELGLLYLDQWRLADADAFFNRIARSPVEAYSSLGRLGHAIVLGLESQAVESNQLFLALLADKPARLDRMRQALFLVEVPQLGPWVARALDYNFANATSDAPFPKKLEPLRNPWAGRRWAGEKNAGKK